MAKRLFIGASLMALAACGGQKLVGVETPDNVPIAEASEGDVPPVTTGSVHAATTGRASTTSTTSSTTTTTTTTTTSTSGATTTTTTGGSTTTSGSTGTTGGSTSGGSTTSGCGDTGPDLSQANTWNMTGQYNLQQAGLPTLNAAFTDVSTALNTINSLGIFSVPSWLLQTFDILASFDVFFDQLNVTSTLVLTPNGTAGAYTANETWTDVSSTDGNGNVVDLSSGQITAAEVNAYTVSVCMPTATFSNHDISGNLAGLITPLLDGLVWIGSDGQYGTFSDLISYTFSSICSSLPLTAELVCEGYLSSSLESEIYNAINNLTVSLGGASVQGTATVENATLMDNGVWAGTDDAGDFNGTFVCNGS